MADEFRIAGVKVKTPYLPLTFREFDISKRNRVASGKMVGDVIATKKRIDVTWKMLKDDEFKLILDTIRANKPYFQVEYPGPGGQQTMICYNGDISATMGSKINGVRYWEEVTIPFIEQ